MNLKNAARGDRNYRNISRNVRSHGAGGVEFRRGIVFAGRHQGILFRMVDRHHARVPRWHYLRKRGRLGIGIDPGIGFAESAAGQGDCQTEKGEKNEWDQSAAFHCKTSRPTARFI